MKLPNTLKRCMGAWRHGLRLTVAAAAGLAALSSTADAAKVVWQSSVDSAAGQEFVDLLEAAGHQVTVLNTGTPSADQIAMINEHDLIIFSRKNSSGNFQGDANQYWDTDITIPAMAMSAYIVRDNRLQWVQGNDLADDTPAAVNIDTGHPVWVCVEPGPWHTDVDRGTSFNLNALVEPGVLIASATGEGDTTEAIVAEWPAGTIAAGPRMLFNAGARELDGSPIEDAGAYNLTATGEAAFLNAVAYMTYLSGNVQPPSGSTVYHQDFTAADGTTDLADGSIISSNNAVAEVEANALVMTRDGTTSSLTGYVLPTLPDLSNGFIATFDFALSGGGDRPADGFSFNFGDLSTSTPEGNGEEGFAGATNDLRVEFDTWDNDGTEPEGFNGIGFDVEVAADNLARCRIPLDSTAWNNNAAFRFNGQARPAWIVWQDGLLDFWVDGVPIFTGVDTGAWTPNGNIGFSARTGGATETLTIDNVNIAACTTISTVSEFGLGGDAPAVINTSGFGDDALTFSDRTHEHNAAQFNDSGTLAVDGANTVPLPAYLVGNQYVQFANDARDQGDYFATVTATHPSSWYLLVDNRANGPAGDTSSPNTTDPVLGGNLQWVIDGGWQRVNTGISPNGQADYTGVDEGGDGGLNQFYSVYTLPYPTNSVTVRNIGAGGNMISLVAAKGFDGTAGDPGPLLLDFGSSGPNANGSATGWTAVNNLVQDEPLSIWPGITITALEDGFNPNNTAAPGTGATFDYVDVPQNVFDDYLFKIDDTADTSAVMRIDGLPAATYSVTVFEGRTTDANQVGKIWVGDEPADENTGNFAGGGSTVIVDLGAGESLFYRHLEDNSGGISGMIIQRATSVPFGLATSTFTGGDAGEGLDLDGDFLYAINMLGAGTTVRDAVFTMDDVAGFTHEFPNMAANWFPGVAYGDTTDDDNLEAILRDIRWAPGANGPVDMTLANLVPGQTYQLQMLFGEACCNRGWDILFDGNPGLERFNVQQIQGGINNVGVGVVVTYSFIPRADVLTITFQQSSPGFPDNNSIIQGLTLETITDTDGDGLDDAIETSLFGDLSQTADDDFDSDGLTNYQEIVFGTDATMDADADSDGLTDAQEILTHGTDPKNADSDNDGLSDGDEINTHGTNPALADSDGDRLSDGDEVTMHGSNPLAVDTDNDGVPDGAEVAMATDPANPAERPLYLTSFTGGDSGEGLDLDGNIIYAINMRGPGGLQVRDALFTDDTVEGFTYDQPNEILAWHAPNYGSTANDDNLEVVMQSIRWNAGPVAMTLSGLTPGNTYKLQLLFAENCCDRGWDIAVEGATIVDDFNVPLLQGGIANPTRGAAVVYQFVAMDDTLEINFVNDAPAFPDNNPILNGLTLEDVPPSALDSLVIHYEFEQAPSDVVENTAEGTGPTLADSLAGWVGTDEQGANGWTYGYRQLPGDGSGAIDYDPSTDFNPFPASWWNGSAWDEPNVDTDNVPWTTIAQNSSHPNGPNSADATPGALDPEPASGNYEHWAIRRWVSDYEGTVTIAYSVAKENVGCGNGITGAIHINGVRQSSTVIAFDDGVGTTTYVEADLVAGDVVDLIHSPVGTDGVSADSCDGGLLSMKISLPASGAPGTLLRIDPAAAFVTGTDSPSLGGSGAMYFNESTGAGAGSYIDTNSLFSELGVFDESYTMMAWVRQSEVGGDKMIFGQTTAPALHNGARDNDYYMAHWGDDLNAGTGEVPSHLNEWTHLAFVYDGNQTIFVNGEPIATRDANNLQLDENLLVGATVIAEDRDFSGWLDDVRVYSAALSEAEIKAVAGIEFADLLKVHYAFEEGSGSTVVNSAVGQSDGTFLRGGVVEDNLVSDQNSPSGGNAMFFNTGTGDGAGSYIDTGLTPSSANVAGAYTMMAWAKQTEQDGDKMIFGQPSGEALHLGGRDTTYLQGHWGDDNQTGGGAVDLNQWTHLAFIYDGDTQTILKNGQVIAQRSGAGDIKEDTALLVGLVQLAENRDFSGYLDDVRIYCEALPFDAVNAIVGFGEDADGDGMEDIWERINFGTTDRNGTGDADADRVNDAAEFANGTDPNSRDSDGDQLWDGTELYATYTNPLNPDSDGDGLDDRFEYFALGTDPNSDDTDRDGVTDGAELAAATITYDFNADPAAVLTPSGNAEWRATGGVGDSGYIALTDAANSQNGIVTFADTTGGGAITAIDFQADLRIGDGTCCGEPAGSQPADGMSINFVPAGTTPTFPNANEEGAAEGLAIAFDAWDSGVDLDPLGPSITVRYNGSVVTEFDTNTMNGAVDDPTSIQTGPLGGLDWAHVRVTLSSDGAVTVTWKGVTIIDNVQTPYVPEPVQIVMAARTGGANENHHVDNVSVALLQDGANNPTVFNEYDTAALKRIDYDFEVPNLTEGIVAHWSLDSTLEDGIGDSDGTLMGGADGDPSYVEGRVGMGVELDGIGEFIEINPANEALFDGAGPDGFSVSIWAKVNAFDKSWQALVAKGEENRWRVHRRSDLSVLTGNGGSADVSEGSTAVDDGEWHHVVLSSRPGVGVTLFVDGAVEGTAGPPAIENNDLPMMIGENPDARGRTWNGVVDEVTFWDRALDGADVAALYNGGAGIDVLTETNTYSTVIGNAGDAGPGLLVLPDGSDPSAQFMDGQLVLAGIATNDPNAVYVDTQNTSDALGVNGTNARYTMLARVRPDSVAGDNMIFGQLGGDALHNGLRGNQVHFGHWGSDSNSGSTTVTPGEWYDLAYRFDGTIQSIFVNGEKVSSSVQPRGLNNPMNVIIGGSREDRAFEGAIEGVQIYSEAFSDDLVTELQGYGEPASDELLIHYEFEDGITPVVRNLGNKGAPDGTVSAQNLIGAFAIGSPSKGGPGTMFFDSTNGDPGETLISTGLTPADAGIMGQPYTMMAWAQPIQQAGGDRMIFGQANGDTGNVLHNGIRDGRQHMGHWGDDLNATSVTVNWNTWEHYTYVWDGTDMLIYVNGELRAQEAHGGLVNSATELIIGATRPDDQDRDFIGYLDDVRIYCGVLDAAQIASIAGIEDTDGDGLIDAFERAYFGPDLSVADAGGDFDGDGLTNSQEIAQGLNPSLADTDGDCWADNLELAYETDPLDFNDFPDIFAESDSPAAVWNIRTVQITEAAGDINNLATVDMVLNGELEILADGVQTSKVINISDGSYGNFQPDETIEAFDAVGDDHVTHVTGYFYMNFPGVITFNSATDDGARLRIDGVDVIVDDVLHGTRNSIENGLPGTVELAAGLHQLDYVVWERGGGYSAELSVPLIVGAYSTFASSPCGWELIPPVDPAEFSTEEVISGNFVANQDGAAEGTVMGAAETTGVIPASNWNNLGPAASQAPMVFDLDFNSDPSAFVTFGGTGGAEWRATGGVDDSGYIAITDAANGLNNTVTFADGTGGATAHSIELSADLRIGDGTCCDGRLADGMSINFVPLGSTPTFEGGAGENGTEQGLAVYFDTWDNDDAGAADVVAIGVKYNNVVVAEVPTTTPNGAVDDPTSIQTGPLGDIGWAPVGISLKPDGTISVDWKGTRIIDGVQTGYEPGPVQLLLGARTGGANENHHVDNINVAIGTTPVLVNSSGGGTPVQVSWAANTIWTTFNPPADNATAHMMNGYIDDTADGDDVNPYSHIAFDCIPYPVYDIYVYFTSDGNERTGEARMNGEEAVFLSTNGNNDPIVFDKATGADEASANPATYAVWRGLTGPSALFEWRRISNNVGVAGFQIVGQRDLPIPGLLAYWNFDDASNPAQSVDLVGGNVGTLTGGAAFTADGEGARGGAGDHALDLGTDSNLQRMDVDGSFLSPLGESNALTVSFWQRNNLANGSSFWAVGPGFDRAFQGHTPWGDGNIYFDNSGGCCNDRISGMAPEGHDYTMWNHYAFVKKPNGEKEVWVNGVLAVSGTNPSALPAEYTTLFIGSGANGDISVQGAMDDVSVWSRALPPETIAELAAGAVPTELYDTYESVVLNDSPVAYWRMEDSVVDGTGGTAGTNNGITFAEGQIGQAAVFDAAAPGDAYIGFAPGEGGLSQLTNLDEGVTPNPNQATSVEFWINTSQVGTADNWRTPLVFGHESPGDGDAQWGYLRADGRIAFSNNDGDHGPHESSVPINDGEWHHVVMTYDWATGVSQLYLDGVFDSDFTGGTNRYHDVDGQVQAMGYNPHVDAGAGDASPHLLSQFQGMLDEVAIYDHILSASRVALHYGVGSPGLGQRNYVEIGGGVLDSDRDGVSDILEGVAGTDAENPHDFLRIEAVAFTPEGMAIEWRAVAGRVYEVEFSENLEPNSWQVIGRYAAEEAGDTASFLDTDPDRRTGYYRARVLQD